MEKEPVEQPDRGPTRPLVPDSKQQGQEGNEVSPVRRCRSNNTEEMISTAKRLKQGNSETEQEQARRGRSKERIPVAQVGSSGEISLMGWEVKKANGQKIVIPKRR